MAEPLPPQLSQGDPEALYGRPNGPGNGPLILNQANAATGDTITRNAAGYWVNAPAGAAVPGGAITTPAVVTATAIQDATKVWSTWYVPMVASPKLTVEFGPTEGEVAKVKLEYETAAS